MNWLSALSIQGCLVYLIFKTIFLLFELGRHTNLSYVNNVNLDQTTLSAASDQVLHSKCLVHETLDINVGKYE